MHACVVALAKKCVSKSTVFCSVFVCYTEVKENSIVHKSLFNSYYYSRHLYINNSFLLQLIINCLHPHPAHTSLARMGACMHAPRPAARAEI